MMLTLGSWIIPALFTLIFFAWAEFESRRAKRSPYGNLGPALVGILAYLVAIIMTLAGWLLWALVA